MPQSGAILILPEGDTPTIHDSLCFASPIGLRPLPPEGEARPYRRFAALPPEGEAHPYRRFAALPPEGEASCFSVYVPPRPCLPLWGRCPSAHTGAVGACLPPLGEVASAVSRKAEAGGGPLHMLQNILTYSSEIAVHIQIRVSQNPKAQTSQIGISF